MARHFHLGSAPPVLEERVPLVSMDEGQTYWDNCRWDASESSPPWVLRKTGDSGYAAFALRNFKKGDLILTEKPLVIVRGDDEYTFLLHAFVNSFHVPNL